MRSRDHWVTQSIRSIGTLGCPSTWLQRYRTLFIFDPHFLVPMEFSAVELEIAVELTLLLVHFMMDDDHHLDLDRMSQVETVASDSPLKPKLVWTQLPQFLLRRPLTVLDHLEYVHGLLPEATTGLYTLHNLAKYVDVHLSCKLMGHLRSHSSKKGGHWDGLRDLDERTDGRLEFCNSMWCHVISSSLGDTADVRFELNPRVKKEGALSEGVFRSVMLWVCFIWGVFVPGGFVGIWILWCVYVCGLPTLVVVSSYTWCGVV